jgi:hypothetical protein
MQLLSGCTHLRGKDGLDNIFYFEKKITQYAVHCFDYLELKIFSLLFKSGFDAGGISS